MSGGAFAPQCVRVLEAGDFHWIVSDFLKVEADTEAWLRSTMNVTPLYSPFVLLFVVQAPKTSLRQALVSTVLF